MRIAENYETTAQVRPAHHSRTSAGSPGPGNIALLQRSAGNAAVAQLLAGHVTVQRCGATPCEECAEKTHEHDREAETVQRVCDPSTQSCPPVDPGPGADVSAVDFELLSTLAQIDAQRPTTNPAMNRVLSRAISASALAGAAPVVAYAGMVGVGGAGASSSVPTGLLATEALAGEGIAAAQGLAAAQGVAATSTAVVEGGSLGATLMSAGEGLLAIEAAGGAEIEAATGPPGWVVGAVVLIAAGVAIGAGYILLRHPDTVRAANTTSTPTTAPVTSTRRYPNQTCENEELDRLQAEKERICGRIPGQSCSPSKVSPKKLDRMPCSLIRLRIQALRDCLAIRNDIQNQCFGGVPDPRHQQAIAEIQNAINQCLALEAVNCAPGHPMANQ
ncbi:hypothetical protein [Nocardia gipuzkoensis]